jgi:hypothetical protein
VPAHTHFPPLPVSTKTLQDGNPAAWSADELRDITAIWRAVAEDFSLFDVDVTTADPGDAALAGKGMRVVIGGSYAGEWAPGARVVCVRACVCATAVDSGLGKEVPGPWLLCLGSGARRSQCGCAPHKA